MTFSRICPLCLCIRPRSTDDESANYRANKPSRTGEFSREKNRKRIKSRAACNWLFRDDTHERSILKFFSGRKCLEAAEQEAESYVVHTSVDYMNFLVPEIDKIFASVYYWGIMDRYEAEKLLENKPEGTFLLRDSAQSDYLFSVSFRRYKRTLHARIEQKNHRFGFDFSDSAIHSSSRITDLIDYYKDPSKCLFFEPQLSYPLRRTFVFSLQNLCRAAIASRTTFDGAARLNLPKSLITYIQQYHYCIPIRTTKHYSPCNSRSSLS